MKKEVINGNQISKWGRLWRVESADGSWDGYELYDTYEEARDAAKEDNENGRHEMV